MVYAPVPVGLVGGNCFDSLACGVRCVNFNRTAGGAIWYIGVARSYIYMGIDGIAPVLSALLAVTVMIP